MTLASDDKVLILLRHAKAEEAAGKTDQERELTGRGRRDAVAAGRWLHEQGFGAELVLCSTATRTRQTWAALEQGGACGEAVHYDRGLYDGGERGALQALREIPAETQVALVVGHNPTMAGLASGLTGGDGSTQAHECLAAGFPTCSMAVLHYSGPWRDLDYGSAALARCHTARG